MAEIKHVEVKKVGGKVIVSVFCRELSSWTDVTFEVDDDENQPSLFCKRTEQCFPSGATARQGSQMATEELISAPKITL